MIGALSSMFWVCSFAQLSALFGHVIQWRFISSNTAAVIPIATDA
jgi:hypothetical protein